MSRSRRAGAAAGAFFVAALVLGAAPTAFAHAAYKDSTPGDGETVSSPPSQITAEFTEPMTESSYLEVYDPCGERVDNGDSNVSTSTMTVTMSADKAGEYTVEFAAQSVDTHVTYGSFSFTSSGGAACEGDDPGTPPGGGGGGSGGGSGGNGSGSGSGSGSGGGAGSSGGRAMASGSGGDGGAGAASTGGGAQSARKEDHRKHATGKKKGNGAGPAAQGPGRTKEPVPFENTGGAAPAPAPGVWDLPMGGVVMALALCVMIGAAGGRVYAGIVSPPRH